MQQIIKSLLKSFRSILDQLPYIKDLRNQVDKQGYIPAGHFYSPVPDGEEVREYLKSRENNNFEPLEININKEEQYKLLQEYCQFYNELPFSQEKKPECRYHDNQHEFHIGDAIYLYSFLRKYQPRKIIEIGSGFSSAVILDTLERFSTQETEVTFIDPYPNRLLSLLKRNDKEKHKIIISKVQDIPIDKFSLLRSGDLLFIDSSHVIKCGSDLQFLIFDVLPRLAPGVFVSFHDIFYPMEYPPEWLLQGRYWNEIYFIRAFLAYNVKWKIHFLTSYVGIAYEEFIKEHMPLILKARGATLYIQRIE